MDTVTRDNLVKELKSFTIAYVLALVAIFVLGMLLGYLLDYEPGGGLGLVASFTAALWTGQKYAMAHKSVPESSASWRLAFLSFIPALIVSLLAMGLFLLVAGQNALMDSSDGLASIPLTFWIGGLVFAASLHILAVRFFYTFGAKNQLKAEARSQGK